MNTEKILKEMDILAEKAAKIREEVASIEDYSVVEPKLDELEAISDRMLELHQMNQEVILENLFNEIKKYFGL